jgi:uncharacterized membrane protein YdjX (TVP38/TMEM64 family)
MGTRTANWISRVPFRAIAGAALLGAFAALLVVTYTAGSHAMFQRLIRLYSFMANHMWLLPCLFVLRLPLFLPASLMLLLTGMICGTLEGELIGVIGLGISGSIEFLVVRGAFAALLRSPPAGGGGRMEWLSRTPFHSVLTLRLCLVPFDVVNIAAAAARVPFLPFAAATVLGVIPTSLPIISAGASLDLRAWLASGHLWPNGSMIHWSNVLLSLVLALLISIHARAIPGARRSRTQQNPSER